MHGAVPGTKLSAGASDLDMTLKDVRIRCASPVGRTCVSASARRGDVVETETDGAARRVMLSPLGSDSGELVPPSPAGGISNASAQITSEDDSAEHAASSPGFTFASAMTADGGTTGRLSVLRLSRCCLGTDGSRQFGDFITRTISALAPAQPAVQRNVDDVPAQLSSPPKPNQDGANWQCFLSTQPRSQRLGAWALRVFQSRTCTIRAIPTRGAFIFWESLCTCLTTRRVLRHIFDASRDGNRIRQV